MFKTLLKKDEGFTLIEVIIVLAIAALIILVVLQAITAAQISNRDTTRKQEVGRMVAILEQSASNTAGVYPADNTAAQASVASYDANLGNKYPVANWDNTGTSCTSRSTNSVSRVSYVRAASTRDYTLGVCLEVGGGTNGYVQLHP